MKDQNVKLTVVDYWNKEHTHRPYQGMLHDDNDEGVDKHDMIRELVRQAGAVDGDQVEITMTVTGKRPFGDRLVRLARPHEYERDAAIPELAKPTPARSEAPQSPSPCTETPDGR